MSDLTSSAVPAEVASDRQSRKSIKIIRPPRLSLATLLKGIGELFYYRDLLLTLSLHRLKVRYKQSVLGWAWALLQPLSLMLIYTVIFSIVTRVPSEGIPYSVFVYAALMPWTLFSTAVMASAVSLVTHSQLVTKVYFPREILPVTYVLVGFCDFCFGSVVLAGMMMYHHLPLTVRALYLFPILAIVLAFSTALALILSALQVRFRDIGLGMPLLMQLWMFATPVVYPLSSVPARFRTFYLLNPMVGVVENFRRVLLQNQLPDFNSLWEAGIISMILLPACYTYFKYKDASIADVI